MNMPGFTAEESMYTRNVRYQATTKVTVYGEVVQPAGPFSDVFNPCVWSYRCRWKEVFYDPVRQKPIFAKICGVERICY